MYKIIFEDPDKPLKFIDLFCGIGGFHQALTNMNVNCVFASDNDEDCRKIYELNYKLKPEGDITTINIETIPDFDILCAGFPCQPFSKAGFQKGFDDEKRGNLFYNICEIVAYHKPQYLLLENVRNLESHDEGQTWKIIYNEIDNLGYYTYEQPVILNTLHFNVPQNRERVIIMCKRKDLGQLPTLPKIPKKTNIKLSRSIEDIVEEKSEENKKYWLTGKMKDVERIWDEFIKILIKNTIPVPKYPIWTDYWTNDLKKTDKFYIKYKNWIDKNRVFYNENKDVLKDWLSRSRNCPTWVGAVRKLEWQASDLRKDDGMDKILWTARGSGIRTKRPDYIPTLVAMSMIPVYGKQSRKLTPRELLRLQSFPEDFQFDEKKIFKQVGNAVNVTMIERCARFLILNDTLFG